MRWLVAATITVLTALVPGAAVAHPLLVRAEPADNARLDSAPRAVRLWFSDPMSPQLSTIEVLDVHGAPVDGIRPVIDAARLRHLVVELPDLAPGAYNVVWKVFSEADGHTVRGHLVFTIGATVNNTTPVIAPTPEPAPALLEVVTRWIGLGATLALVGAVTTGLSFVGREKRVLQYAGACGAVAVIANLGMLIWTATTLQSDGVLPLIAETRWGMLWAARVCLLVLLTTLVTTRRSSTTILAAIGISALLTQALSGHASGSPVGVAADALHLLAASVWIGGLAALLVARRYLSRATWLSFGRVAAVCIGTLVATGLYSAGIEASSIDALLETLYGHALLLKLLVVLALASTGVASALSLRHRLATNFVRLEVALGAVVVLVASVLASSPPARGPSFEPPVAVPTIASQSAHDLLITLEVKPSQPGENVLTLRAASTRRPVLAPIDRLRVEASPPDATGPVASLEAVQVEPGLFRLGGDFLNSTGAWRITVVAQRSGLPDEAATFDWNIAAPAPPRSVIVSDAPLRLPLTVSAVIAGGATLLVSALAVMAARRPPRRFRVLRSHAPMHQEGVSP